MKLCECGCGKEVIGRSDKRFVVNSHGDRLRKKRYRFKNKERMPMMRRRYYISSYEKDRISRKIHYLNNKIKYYAETKLLQKYGMTRREYGDMWVILREFIITSRLMKEEINDRRQKNNE